MPKLLLATNNKGKVEEYRDLLKGLRFELVTPAEVGINLEVEESGSTFQENARIKAEAFARASGLLTLADDSGLEVDALNGEPGIRSSRYAGDGASDADKISLLLSKLKDIPAERRTARFRCVIAIAWPDGKIEYAFGKCEGTIALAPRGNKGFGYDPVFYISELQKTMAEIPEDLKNRISHRARAVQEARRILEKA
jgi:XTP/dITP diphosphohydrolase